MCFSLLLLATPAVYAQNNNKALTVPPIFSLFDYFKVGMQDVKKAAPHFPAEYNNTTRPYNELLNQWLESYPREWASLQNLPQLANKGIGWASYGVPEKYVAQKETVASSWWQWYSNSGVSSDTKKKLFPHFPDLDKSLKGDTLGANFDRKVGMWQRLYPKEYIAFLNTPEIKALNPYAPGTIKIEYMPRFIGTGITAQFPVKENTGDVLQDDYNYQLRIRNWYFVYKPEEFEKRYGKDYEFQPTFNADEYRKTVKMLIERQKNPDYNTIKNGK